MKTILQKSLFRRVASPFTLPERKVLLTVFFVLFVLNSYTAHADACKKAEAYRLSKDAVSALQLANVGTGGNYPTLKAAFDAINAGNLTGAVTLQIISSTTETATASLNASGTGLANYTSVLIYATGAGYTIAGNLSTPLVNLNGADNVVIDGRVNATGVTPSLTLSNAHTSTAATTIQLINSAENNSIRYAILSSSALSGSSGTIYLSSAASGNGNDNNTIEYCNLTNTGGNRPLNSILSYGTAGRENSGNIVRFNSIYNFFNENNNSNGINISGNSTDWIVAGNSLYESGSMVPLGSYTYNAIRIGTANTHLVSGNYIGGSAPLCAGAPWTMLSSFATYFGGIFITGTSGSPTLIQNNIIQNFNYSSTSANPWDGIYLALGNAAITGNTIGAATGTNAIVLTTPNAAATATITGGVITAISLVGGGSGFTTAPQITFTPSGSTTPAVATATVSGGIVTGFTITNGGSGYTSIPSVNINASGYSTSHGLRCLNSGTINLENNNIGSITTYGNAAYTHCFEGIVVSGVANSVVTVNNNLIGSLSTANSIKTSSAAAASIVKQDLRGIYINSAISLATINGNTIANMTSVYTGASISKVDGICSSSLANVIQNNTIRDITSCANSVTVRGIQQNVTTAGGNQLVSGNTVFNLSNTHATAAISVIGIDYYGPVSGNNMVSNNFVYGLTAASSSSLCEIDGILIGNGATTVANNIVNLGTGMGVGYKIYGISENSTASTANNNSLYFNSVYLTGTVSSGVTSSTSAFWSASNTAIRNIRNNILVNVRSGGTTGKHYAVRVAGTNGLTIDFNDYMANGGSFLGSFNSSDKNTLALWKTATSQDAGSLNTNPTFNVAGGVNPLNYYTSAILPAATGTGITTDFTSLARSSAPKMGALETTSNVWSGATSSNFGTASNWQNGLVPTNGSDIAFAVSPFNNCVLDQNRSLRNVTNAQGTYKLMVNGYQLTLLGNLIFSNNAKIDATAASSVVTFAGTLTQTIPSGAFVANTLNGCIVNNPAGVTINDNIVIAQPFTLTSGALNLGAYTLALNGSVAATAGTLIGGSTSNITIGGSGTAVLPAVILNNLTLNRPTGIGLGGAVSISGTLALTAGSLSIGSNTLTLSGSSPTRVTGAIDASDNASTLAFTNPTAIVLPISLFTSSVNNLSINGPGGVTSADDITLNGILGLSSANPSATKGSLDMWDGFVMKTLLMGANATTTGIGDTTGIVKRTSISPGISYSFGNQFMKVSFVNTGTLPSQISLKIRIGTVPTWSSGAIARDIEVIQTGSVATSATVTYHYLTSELNGNDEQKLVLWSEFNNTEYGGSAYDTTDNWISLSNVNLAFFASSFDGLKDITLDEYSTTNTLTWNGSLSTSWTSVQNWTPNVGPSSTKNIIIPDAATTSFSPVLPSTTTVKSLNINAGGIVNSVALAQFTISGRDAWNNNGGMFNPNTSNIIFTNAAATVSGTTNFYDLTINSTKTLSLTDGCVMRIAGAMTNNGTWNAVIAGPTTVEYNGAAQTIVNPNGGTPGYFNLILSGSGTKTMASSVQAIYGNLNLSGTVTATAASTLTVAGNFGIGNGTTFNTGNFNHAVAGDFDNDGTFNSSSGHSITLNGAAPQALFGASTTGFDQLTVNNPNGVNMYNNVNVSNSLLLTNGALNLESATLGILGTVAKTSGFIQSGPFSSLTIGGTGAITLASDLFVVAPTFTNFTVNRSGGVTIAQDMTVTGAFNLLSGALNINNNNFSIGVSGSIAIISPSATKMIIANGTGQVRKILTDGVPFTYPIGDNNSTAEYSPLSLTLSGDNSPNDYFGISVSNAKHPNNASAGQYLKRYWNINHSGTNSHIVVLSATYTSADIVGTETNIAAAELPGTFNQANNPWVKQGVLSSNLLSMNTLSIAPAQSLAVSGISAANPSISATGGTVACGGSGVTLTTSVSAEAPVIYNWTPPIFLNDTTIANPVASNVSATTVYTVVAKDGNGISTSTTATVSVGAVTNWTGTWDNGIPTSNSAATIAADYTLTADMACCSLTVNNNATVVVAAGVDLTLYGALTVSSGSFTLDSNANLLQTTNIANTGNITILRDSAPIVRLDHTLWASPVTGQQTLQEFSPSTLSNRFYKYNTNTNGYSSTLADGTFPLAVAIGIRAPNNWGTTQAVWTGRFSGVPNNGNVSVILDTNGFGYNGVGNPYPSTISGSAFVTANSANITGTLYFYAHTLAMNSQGVFPSGTNYAVWNPGTGGTPATVGAGGTGSSPLTPNGTIQLGEGFLVKATTSGNIVFNNAMRAGNNANQFFRTANTTTVATDTDTIERHRIWLKLSSETDPLNIILVGYATGATMEADYGYDGLSFGATGSALYSLIDGNDYCIQGRPLPFETTDVVPLGLRAAAAGNYSISVYDTDGLFSEDQQVYIKDNLRNSITNINTFPYVFSSEEGIFSDRLEIVYADGTLGVGNQSLQNSTVLYTRHKTIYIESGSDNISGVKIFDIRGRLIFEENGMNQNHFQTNQAGLAQQILLVQITDISGQSITKKVIL